MRVGSLFTGIGGFDLAGEWCGHQTIWTSEIDPYCVELLKERFPGVPNLGDITAIDWSGVERPDIITGGFPCQDISYAGKGAGLEGARSGLWYEYARAVRSLGPRYVVVENVAALFTRGLEPFSAPWPISGTMRSGRCTEQTMWALPTSGTGFGYSRGDGKMFATPAAADAVGSHGGGMGRSLRTDVRMFPTPKSSPSGPDFARMDRGESGGDDLATAVKRMPTPSANDWKGSSKDGQRRG